MGFPNTDLPDEDACFAELLARPAPGGIDWPDRAAAAPTGCGSAARPSRTTAAVPSPRSGGARCEPVGEDPTVTNPGPRVQRSRRSPDSARPDLARVVPTDVSTVPGENSR
jgi:hypothetical protein